MGVQKSFKLQCSYGGRILPHYPDGNLRYNGGNTRVLSVNRSISFAELMMKIGEMCEAPNLRCQLPSEDMDSLISITCDEDLQNLFEEYDHAPSTSPKIRAFVSSHKKASPPASSADETSPSYSASMSSSVSSNRNAAKPPLCPVSSERGGGKMQRREHAYGNYMIHSRN